MTCDHDYEQANRTHFDQHAHTFEGPKRVELARRLSKAMLDAYEFDEDETTVMDFACGTGLVSRQLAPYCKSILGVDISQGMVDNFNAHVFNQGLEPEEMRAVLADDLGSIQQKFDVVVCAVSYHHLPSIDETTDLLASFLKQGGVLLVADLLALDADIFRDHANIVAHCHGFDESTMRITFEHAGLVDFTFETIAKAKKNGHDVEFFLARAVKS